MIKDIQTGYLVSSYFKDIYLYLAQNKLPSYKSAIKKIEVLAEKIYTIRFIIIQDSIKSRKETVVLAILEVCADKVIILYHSSLFAGHQGVVKTYLTISNEFFVLNLINYLCSYININIYHLMCNEKPINRTITD